MNLEEQFDTLAKEWRETAGLYSMWNGMRRQAAAQKLVDLGKPVVPLILKTLETDKWIAWSQLLCEITGTRPDYQPDKVAGGGFVAINVKDFAQAWIDWGKANGYTI